MVLTNLGAAVDNRMACSIKESWRIGIAQREGKSKISKSVEMWFNVIGSTTSPEGVIITSFCSRYGKVA